MKDKAIEPTEDKNIKSSLSLELQFAKLKSALTKPLQR